METATRTNQRLDYFLQRFSDRLGSVVFFFCCRYPTWLTFLYFDSAITISALVKIMFVFSCFLVKSSKWCQSKNIVYRICLSTCSTDTWLPKPQSVFSIRSLTLCTFVSVLGSDKNVIGHCGLKKHKSWGWCILKPGRVFKNNCPVIFWIEIILLWNLILGLVEVFYYDVLSEMLLQ